jgi:tRNA(His) guanylyltransferase
MKFDELNGKMRVYETAMDQTILPEMFIIARLDGRGFTRLTKEVMELEKPFDARFRDAMIETTQHLMNCGFKIIYGYTESDEISLLFHLEEKGFERKVRKIISILAGEASAKFTQVMGQMGAFDCRLSTLPNASLVIDYFRWRSEDAHRNSLNAYCYWKLRESGQPKAEATRQLSGVSISQKNEILFQFGINYNHLPNWQKRGIGFYYENTAQEAMNPLTKEVIQVMRRTLKCEMDLPIDDEYSNFVTRILTKELPKP